MSTASSKSTPMTYVKLLGAVLLILGIGYGLYYLYNQSTFTSKANAEKKKQEQEVVECNSRLKEFHAAIVKFKKEHKGSPPTSYKDLVPKYIANPEKLLCPTGKRWIDSKKAVAIGRLALNGKEYNTTYGFQIFTGSYHRAKKKLKEKAPEVICETHREALYRASYETQPRLGSFDEDNAKWLISEVKDAPILCIRSDGSTDPFKIEEL